jgi:hypothetical protein
MLKTYDISEEPQDDLYKALIDYCKVYAGTVLLVLREPDWIEPSIPMFLEQFRTILIMQENVKEWPGTKLMGEAATVFKYRLTSDLADYLKNEVNGLYKWQQPQRLEDLCFLRQDGTALLVTIAHENDAYLELTDEEHENILQVLPALKIIDHMQSNIFEI